MNLKNKTLCAGLLMLTMLFAGCIGESGNVDEKQDEPVITKEKVGLEAEEPAPSMVAEESTGINRSVQYKVKKFSFEGTVPIMACVPVGLNACTSLASVNDNDSSILVENAKVVSFEMEVTWTAVSPTMESLRVWTDLVSSCGSGCTRYEDAVVVQGTSPLTISVNDTLGMGDGPLGVWVRPVNMLPSPLFGYVSTGQEFTVRGTATIQV